MSFYGAETAPSMAQRMYRELLLCWSAETCSPGMRPKWSPANPTLGQCSITSFIVQDLLGGEVWALPLPNGGRHCFNIVDGSLFDLTSEQFEGMPLDYGQRELQSREKHFSDPDKYARYLLLKKKLEERMGSDE